MADQSPAEGAPTREANRSYHHGDVPEAALAAALDHLDRHGEPSFTLRSIAQEIGISHPSLYNHFASRDALIDALAIQGFHEMLARARALVDASPGPLPALESFGRDIIAFAQERPGLYRLMFGPDVISRKTSTPALAEATEAPLRVAASLVAQAQQAGRLRGGDPLLVAASMWATAHGIALLIIDGRLGVLGRGGDDLVELTLDAIVRGLDAEAPPTESG